MKNKQLKNTLKKIMLLLRKIYLELKNELKKLYNNLIQRIRLSILLKLNLMYVARLFSLFFVLNIIILLAFGAYEIYKIDRNINNTYSTYSKYIVDNNISTTNITKQNKEILSLLNNDPLNNVTIFDLKNNLIFEQKSIEGFRVGNLNKITNDRYVELIQNSNDKFSFDFGLRKKLSIHYYLLKPLKVNNTTINIHISSNLNESLMLTGATLTVLIIIQGFVIVISVIKTSLKIKKILNPIEEMNKTVQEITVKNLDTRLNIRGSQNELKDLANTFNLMLDRIQNSYENQNQFVSDASHELRTPISVIQGYIKMLKRWGKDDKEVLDESIIAIESESINMKNLIEQLLFLARGDKGTQYINKDIFDLNELIDEVVKETKLIDDNHHIISCDRNDLFKINADKSLLKEALRIFIDNAIKYTPNGKNILISSYQFNNEATIIIKDSGIGISSEDLPKIFDRFYRADKSRARESGGTGLGLSIAKWVVNTHNGKIDVSSTINVGTTIMLKIPIT